MDVGAVQPPIDLRELVVHVADAEAAPLRVVVVLAGTYEKLAQGRSHLLDGAVIAEGRVVVVRVDATEQRLGRLVQEIAEQLVDRCLARIGTGGQTPTVAELAVDEERKTAVEPRIVVASRIVSVEAFHRAAGTVFGQRQFRHADVEPVIRFELEVAQIQLTGSVFVEDGHFDRVRTGRQNLLGDEAAVLVHGNGPAGNVHLVTVGNIAAANTDRAAAEPDVLCLQAILAVRRE